MDKIHTFSKPGSPDMLLSIRQCEPTELRAIMGIQDKITALIPDTYRYQPTTEAEIYESLLKDICLGAYDGKKMVGFTILLNLRDTPRNLAHDMEYAPDYARLCATNDGTWVDPEYQGYGIQYYFSTEKDELAAGMGAVELLACTSPVNYASQRSMIKNGYRIIAEKRLFGGHRRYILSKEVAAAAGSSFSA